MNTIYHEALQKGREWSAKYAGAKAAPPPPPYVPKPRKRTPEQIAQSKRDLVDRRKVKRAARNRRLEPIIFQALRTGEAMNLRALAKVANTSIQQANSVVEDLRAKGAVHSVRVAEVLWVALAGDEIPAARIEAERRAKVRGRSHKRRTIGTEEKAKTTRFIRSLPGGVKWEGEAAEVVSAPSEGWRTPQ